MDNDVKEEFKNVYRKLKCKANCGSGGGGQVIEVTKTQLLNLIASNSIIPGALYIVSGITGFTTLIVNGITTNSISNKAYGKMLVPDYTIAGTNLGQMDGNNIS